MIPAKGQTKVWSIGCAKHIRQKKAATFGTEKFFIEFHGSDDEAYAFARDLSNLMKRTVDGKPVVFVIAENGVDSFDVGNP